MLYDYVIYDHCMTMIRFLTELVLDDGFLFTSGQPLLLTDLIKSGNVELAQELSRVTRPLHGLHQSDVVESFSGFLKVNERANRNIFFWFFPAMVSSDN